MLTKNYSNLTLLITTMPDGSKWGVDVAEVALNRAENYADEFDGDTERSLNEDTRPLFEECPEEISDWAVNNMNWDDFRAHYKVQDAPEIDFQDGWMSGEKEIESF